MRKLDIHHCKPKKMHVSLAMRHGKDHLGEAPPGPFYANCPDVPNYERAEPGCLIKTHGCVMPHTDTWLGGFNRGPRNQRSLFWLIDGEVQFKIDGAESLVMNAGNWVVFDHRREHMVLADGKWLGVAWQLRPARKMVSRATPNG